MLCGHFVMAAVPDLQDRLMKRYPTARREYGATTGLSAQYLEAIGEEPDYGEEEDDMTATERARSTLTRDRHVEEAEEVSSFLETELHDELFRKQLVLGRCVPVAVKLICSDIDHHCVQREAEARLARAKKDVPSHGKPAAAKRQREEDDAMRVSLWSGLLAEMGLCRVRLTSSSSCRIS